VALRAGEAAFTGFLVTLGASSDYYYSLLSTFLAFFFSTAFRAGDLDLLAFRTGTSSLSSSEDSFAAFFLGATGF
jgi:hypothetical protein